MKPLTDRDWEQVNAWADGELPEGEAPMFRARLNAEPDLAEALASVRRVTSALSAMRPEPGIAVPPEPAPGAGIPADIPANAPADIPANTNRHPWVWTVAAMAAGAVAVVALLMLNAVPGALDVHRGYLAQTFQLPPRTDLRNAGGGATDGFPLLGEANLFLAVTDVQKTVASAHYVGVRGCRLTVLRGDYAPAQVTGHVQARQWLAGDSRYQVIATGMDAAKFAAVATYLEQSTQERLRDATVLTLREAVQSATNCRSDLS